ncbi:hypothetical protein PG996_014374 [Apiospora saccharicola]|uniref:DUF7730 domain-containing protein n=1 Tax=Apiospora saccharicola TaxID=335842 RepID=A0ABR1TK58_9PEZI
MFMSGQSDSETSSPRPTGEQSFPNLDAMASEADEQSTSPFLSKLPIELRNEIYMLLWRDAGLKQHILVDKDHGPKPAMYAYMNIMPHKPGETTPEKPITRFSHAACVADHTALDERQEQIAKLTLDEFEDDEVWCERLASPWVNHWRCEEAHQAALNDPSRPSQRSPFLPMMLVCRKMYLECRASVYGALTFVIHDPCTLHSFLIARRSPIVDEIRHIYLSIRLPMRTKEAWLKPKEAETIAMWRTSCQALSDLRSLVSVYLWLEAFPLANNALLSTVPAVNPFVFDSRLASILTVDIPANPSRPEVWKGIAALDPPFKIRARGMPEYFTEPNWPDVIRKRGGEAGPRRAEHVAVRGEPVRRIR